MCFKPCTRNGSPSVPNIPSTKVLNPLLRMSCNEDPNESVKFAVKNYLLKEPLGVGGFEAFYLHSSFLYPPVAD
ncbi:unnamed protein product [Rodentolepis nana]|uniref:Ovule protein n=1 Tax=Rodentolepis nana TaxID=102285 RepID=A0A0R3TIE4_RODNA|nr:unnamed protein product [Rodentolepis nana]